MAKNKLVRSDNYTSRRAASSRTKSALRKERAKLEEKDPTLRVRRQAEHVPVTIEQKRRYDPGRLVESTSQVTQTEAANLASKSNGNDGENDDDGDSENDDDDDDVHAKKERSVKVVKQESDDAEDDEDDEEEERTNGVGEGVKSETTTDSLRSTATGMRTLITTSPNPTKISYHFMELLRSVFPASETIRRGSHKYTLQDIARFAGNRGYASLIVVNEDRKRVNAISIVSLPLGPTCYFSVSNLVARQMATHTTHAPELILQNFTTSLGQTVAGCFRGLFEAQRPEVQGRQVVTLHNSRDFIFFRRHRYLFGGDGDKVRVQEIGPRFTLKCREVVDGVGRQGSIVWVSNAGLESDRKRLFL